MDLPSPLFCNKLQQQKLFTKNQRILGLLWIGQLGWTMANASSVIDSVTKFGGGRTVHVEASECVHVGGGGALISLTI